MFIYAVDNDDDADDYFYGNINRRSQNRTRIS